MEFCCYIIFSHSINRYYIGYTSDIAERVKLHNTGYFGGRSFTSKARDWELYLIIPCRTIEQAISIESIIKKMKSRRYIENLKKHPEIIDNLINTTQNKFH